MKIYVLSNMVVDDLKMEQALLTPRVFKSREEAEKLAREEIAEEYRPEHGYDNLEVNEDSYGTVTEISGYYKGGLVRYRIDEEEV